MGSSTILSLQMSLSFYYSKSRHNGLWPAFCRAVTIDCCVNRFHPNGFWGNDYQSMLYTCHVPLPPGCCCNWRNKRTFYNTKYLTMSPSNRLQKVQMLQKQNRKKFVLLVLKIIQVNRTDQRIIIGRDIKGKVEWLFLGN